MTGPKPKKLILSVLEVKIEKMHPGCAINPGETSFSAKISFSWSSNFSVGHGHVAIFRNLGPKNRYKKKLQKIQSGVLGFSGLGFSGFKRVRKKTTKSPRPIFLV